MVGYKPFKDALVKKLAIKKPRTHDVGLAGNFVHMAMAGLIMAAGGYRIEEFTLEFPRPLRVADIRDIVLFMKTHYEKQGFGCLEETGDPTFEKDGVKYCAVFDVFEDWMRFCFDRIGDDEGGN